MILIETLVFNTFQENTYILQDISNECVIVDPGCSSNSEKKAMDDFIKSKGLTPVAVINTHCHIDHILGCEYVQKTYRIPFYIHKLETDLLQATKEYANYFGLTLENTPQPDKYLEEGDEFHFGNSVLAVIHVPGHSPGSICLYSKGDNIIITGDVLFNGSIGRSDLPGGDYYALIKNIKTKLLVLPREVQVFPGHGPMTNIGQEYDTNPFLK
jgi:hydroxyacylglutathione hydrolase